MIAPKYSFSNFLGDLWNFVKPYKWKFFLGSFLRFSSDLANLYPAWALSQIVVLLSQANFIANQQTIVWLCLVWTIFAIYIPVAHAVAKYFLYQVAEKIALDAKSKGLQHIYSLDLDWQEKENTGNKMKRIDHAAKALNETIRLYTKSFIEASINTLGIFLIFTNIDPVIGIALGFFMITYFMLALKLTHRAAHQSKIVSEVEEDLEGISYESLNNIRTIKSLGISHRMIKTINEVIANVNKEIKKRITLFQFRNGAIGVYYSLFEIALIVYIIFAIIQGQYAVSVLVLFFGYLRKVDEAIEELSEGAHDMVIYKIQVSRLIDIFAVNPSIETGVVQKPYPQNWENIELKNLEFSYGDDDVLSGIDLNIKRGERIGIVGLSGAGKSTLFKLLMDLYENYRGDLLIGGTSLRDIDRFDYINNVAVVLQETELFNASLKDNILLAAKQDQEYSEARFKEAIETANLQDVIARLPKGVDTVVGEKGVKLSGGEKQSLGIARALYRNPDILLLDEATSHLDVNSEKKIQESLHKFFQKVTAIVIAHRLSTIREMDRIIVLQSGKILEQGTFEELIAEDAVFAEMWRKQKL